ncbi:hypothetical protein L7F22_064111 [Adiantum nelumboides]|nr:hypothetical protein [Adiantum nelumboides]
MELPVTKESAAVQIAKENSASTPMTGKAFFISSQVLCPVSTCSAFALCEQSEIRGWSGLRWLAGDPRDLEHIQTACHGRFCTIGAAVIVSTSCATSQRQANKGTWRTLFGRAYKLGKQKCSYNQVELVVKDMHGSDSELQVSEAIETAIGAEIDDLLKESCLKFNVRFVNNDGMHLYIYVVYASPYCSTSRGGSKQTTRYYWVPVTRLNFKVS